MFRHLIDQVQHLVDLHGFPPPPPPIPTVPPSPTTTVLAPPLYLHDYRWCFGNLENSVFENNCENVIMKVTKSKKTKKKQKQKQTENSGSNESLNEEIWRHFPEELYENVIARLPIATIFRFRSVCQNWNSLLTSNTFTRQCARFIPPQPWFYIMTHEKANAGAMYDPVSTKWYYLFIPKMPTERIISPVASAGGLLCFHGNGGRSFFVCNPLTNTFKKLPDRLSSIWSIVAVEMILNKKSNTGGYQIMLVASNGEYEVYDSVINKWTLVESLPDCIKLPLSSKLRFNTVAANGLIYFLRSDPYGIVSFDMESKVWKQYLVPPPPLSRDLALVECGGRIMLVGLVTKSAASSVSVWELQKMTLLWKEVDRMPNVMSLEFYGKHVSLCCLGNSGLVMLSLVSGTMNRLITYDILKKEWLKVPDCAMGIAIGTAFHPSLTAIA
ncbi:putative F-box domain, galactose oxidase/kelch, beta-propeller, kelch-type beta propeller [Helianthus annuus]|uniref:F-box domain, galactose oxidase/kelch, beta-propeller, kelch-type beta propeller n=1 Tax=Helianthus annuus TaxID=4232 RepID=A0A251UK06_HELAN|nr:F-box only protein 6 [Helianthus annuus]KAF5754146.1 putative F-box domain, galactose oxidase/kelch, beta-propeller, kelch-type beta propeller [Helianthus annuus]KAJ0432093.1 putative F-box domain, galactose oxidase/kelch, beta-propeller, kelch-type beta propeller [Helianthus annuus]KAJ0631342.1 putative F-box domain, galactose oxidase/kelch, beta-propeller, kelch-type beta propeller [Helianthus annuus]KAJ0635235.1 putative F-box domain, galactose oxidase/kelch, beta-propeller, kelch-type be